MPTYEYRCRSCEHQFEIQQSITDEVLTTCPECGG
ncbi:MAG: zinc ribbon domain-containing protein, partial [Microthrixaceae bacterium]|nr:zinc ribbon domain-containing protein [Microthrixaceae bacterium]